MRTLVSLSGGMDSTYLLWKLLSETTDEVTAINLDWANTDPYLRRKYDLRSFSPEDWTFDHSDKPQTIAAWLKTNVRNFTTITEPMVAEFMSKDINYPNNPPSYLTRYAVSKINNNQFDRICIANEWENDGAANGGTVGRNRRPGAWVAHEIFVAEAKRGRIDFTLLDMDYNQAYALAEMPKELVDLVRYPKTLNKAKADKTSWFKRQLNEGKTPAEAGAIAKAKCMLPNGKWHSMKFWVTGQEPTEATTWDMPTWPSSYEVPSSG